MGEDNESPRAGGRDEDQTSRGSHPMSPSIRPEDGSRSDIRDVLGQLAIASRSGSEFEQFFAQLWNPNPYPLPIGYYNRFFPHGPLGLPQLPPVSSLDFTWNQLVQQQGHHPMYNLPHQTPVLPPFISFLKPPEITPLLASSIQLPQQQHMVSDTVTSTTGSVSSIATGVDLGEVEQAATAEEKRRRNTAASARFRTKKKQRTVNLEQSVSDLTGRAEELERQVIDLRRENGWLKEIVTLKGTHAATAASAQQRLALGEAVQAAGINLASGSTNISSAGASSSKVTAIPEAISFDEDSDGSYSETGKKRRSAT